MEGISLKSRAIAFAMCVGAGSFILSIIAGGTSALSGPGSSAAAANALVVAIVCAAMSWASADRALASVAAAVDSAIKRLAQAAHGDFESRTPAEVREFLPELADSMDALFTETRSTFDSIHNLAMYDPVTTSPTAPISGVTSSEFWPNCRQMRVRRCCSSIWTISNRSTIRSAMRMAISCSRKWRTGCAR